MRAYEVVERRIAAFARVLEHPDRQTIMWHLRQLARNNSHSDSETIAGIATRTRLSRQKVAAHCAFACSAGVAERTATAPHEYRLNKALLRCLDDIAKWALAHPAIADTQAGSAKAVVLPFEGPRDPTVSDKTFAAVGDALAHPVRARIVYLIIDADGPVSPGWMAREMGAPVANVAHHVRRLNTLECIEMVAEGSVRNAQEHFYGFTSEMASALPLVRAITQVGRGAPGGLCEFAEALSHLVRVGLLRELAAAQGPQPLAALAKAVRVPVDRLRHHIRLLGVVGCVKSFPPQQSAVQRAVRYAPTRRAERLAPFLGVSKIAEVAHN